MPYRVGITKNPLNRRQQWEGAVVGFIDWRENLWIQCRKRNNNFQIYLREWMGGAKVSLSRVAGFRTIRFL